jgi:hypothetical protein
LEYSFSGFNPGEGFAFAADVDKDGSIDLAEDFRNVFFNNGSTVLNSVFSVTFAGGGVLSMALPENPTLISDRNYRFVLTGEVPVPGTLLLLAAGMIGFRTRLLKA